VLSAATRCEVDIRYCNCDSLGELRFLLIIALIAFYALSKYFRYPKSLLLSTAVKGLVA